MDHLTWLMQLQESDEAYILPAWASVGQAAGSTAQTRTVSGKETLQSLTVALQNAELAAERISGRRSSEDTASYSGRTMASEAGGAAVYAGGQNSVYTQVFQDGGGIEMEEISRFFERDARRYG